MAETSIEELTQVLRSPEDLRELLIRSLEASEARVQHLAAENAELAKAHLESLRCSEEEAGVALRRELQRQKALQEAEVHAVQSELDWSVCCIKALENMHQSFDGLQATPMQRRLEEEQASLQMDLDAARGAVRELRGEEMARRWALLASETWDAERRAGEEEAAAEVVSLVDRLRKDVHEVQVALSQAQSTSTSTRREYETLRRVMSAAGAPPEATAAELRQMDTEYHKQRNALVVTQDAVWSAQQQAAYREVQVVSMRREGAKIAWQLEEACGNLPRLEDLCEKEAWEQRCMERERQAAVVAEEQTAAGRRQLQEEVQVGRQRLDELRKSLEWTQEQTAEEEAQRLAELRALKREQRREEDELAASSALVARQEQVADENRQLRQCWQEELQEVSVLEESTAGLRKDAAAERVRGKTWQDKLRRSVEEAKELRRSLQESESQCQVHRQALQKARQRPSELAGIKAAFVSASASTWRESMSDFGSSLVKSPASASSADRRQRLSAELRAAETLYANTKLQVSEMRSQIRMLQLEQGASRASGPRALPAANSDVSAGLLRRRQAQAERRASLRLRSVAEALGRQSQDASRSLASETLAISESSEEAPEEDVVEELHSLTVPSNMPGASKDDRQVPPPPASISACSSLPEYLRQRAEATRRAILRGEIHAAEMALELRPSAQIP